MLEKVSNAKNNGDTQIFVCNRKNPVKCNLHVCVVSKKIIGFVLKRIVPHREQGRARGYLKQI